MNETGKEVAAREQAYQIIKKLIISDELHIGEVTSVNELIEKISIGRSPVRDAILKLNAEGLVQVIPRKGIVISGISLNDVRELKQLRLAIELFVVESVVEKINDESIQKLNEILGKQEMYEKLGDEEEFYKADDDFHLTLVSMLQNSRMYNIIEDSRRQLYEYGFSALTMHYSAKDAVKEHQKIISALRQKDKNLARKELMAHLTWPEIKI